MLHWTTVYFQINTRFLSLPGLHNTEKSSFHLRYTVLHTLFHFCCHSSLRIKHAMTRSVCELLRLQEQHLSDIYRCYKKLKQKRRKRLRTFCVLVNFHDTVCKAGTHTTHNTSQPEIQYTQRRQGMSKRLTASFDFNLLYISNTRSYLTPKLMLSYGTHEATLSQLMSLQYTVLASSKNILKHSFRLSSVNFPLFNRILHVPLNDVTHAPTRELYGVNDRQADDIRYFTAL
jgi:hypothetical protein